MDRLTSVGKKKPLVKCSWEGSQNFVSPFRLFTYVFNTADKS